jgi:hypothetical protein
MTASNPRDVCANRAPPNPALRIYISGGFFLVALEKFFQSPSDFLFYAQGLALRGSFYWPIIADKQPFLSILGQNSREDFFFFFFGLGT